MPPYFVHLHPEHAVTSSHLPQLHARFLNLNYRSCKVHRGFELRGSINTVRITVRVSQDSQVTIYTW